MNTYLNYLIEANLGLCFFLLVYCLFFRKENDFIVKRYFLLTSVLGSLLFPLLHFENNGSSIPSISQVIPTYWLPEIVIGETDEITYVPSKLSFWIYFQIIYGVGLCFFFIRFVVQLIRLSSLINKSKPYPYGQLNIVETTDNRPAFSFFNFIFIGQTDKLSPGEKQQIIIHESAHAHARHSFDILLLSSIGIFFWFNPVIKIYKKLFVQLHEFEADARAVENRDVNNYCGLLAKVAILSADIQLANHFNQSLTLKRIEMMRTIKKKIKTWKIITIASVMGMFFFVVACQDQVMNEVTNAVQSSTMALEIPPLIREQITKMEAEHPGSKVIALELNDEGKESLRKIQERYGLPTSMNVISIHDKDFERNGLVNTYTVVVYDSKAQQLADATKMDGQVFTVVEESALPQIGMTAFYEYIATNLKYPIEARAKGIEGKVFIEFIVNTDGSLSDLKVLKGIGAGCDDEALRVLTESPAWNPGKQRGMAVRQRMILPVLFRL